MSDIITVCKQIHHVRIYQMHLYQNDLQSLTALHCSELGYIVQLSLQGVKRIHSPAFQTLPLGNTTVSSPRLLNQASSLLCCHKRPSLMKHPVIASSGYCILFSMVNLNLKTLLPSLLTSCTHCSKGSLSCCCTKSTNFLMNLGSLKGPRSLDLDSSQP